MALPQINGLYTIPFLALFCYLIFPPLFKAISSLKPLDVRLAVKAGIMALILLDATIAAGFAGWWYGLIILALFPLSRLLARVFAVT
jgi:4-hydroxybenzoate polyprenyltransferase